MIFDYLYIFLQSNLLECPFYYGFHRRHVSLKKSLALTTLINGLTHPIIFFLIMSLDRNYIENILIAEAFAIIAETFIHSWATKMPIRQAFAASLVANIVSWQVAPLLTYLLFF